MDANDTNAQKIRPACKMTERIGKVRVLMICVSAWVSEVPDLLP